MAPRGSERRWPRLESPRRRHRRRGGGRCCRRARRDFFERIVFADLDPTRPEGLVHRLGDPRFAAAQVDASDTQSVAALARDADVVLNATDPRFNSQIFAAAFETRCTYLDMAMTLSGPHPTEPYSKPG